MRKKSATVAMTFSAALMLTGCSLQAQAEVQSFKMGVASLGYNCVDSVPSFPEVVKQVTCTQEHNYSSLEFIVLRDEKSTKVWATAGEETTVRFDLDKRWVIRGDSASDVATASGFLGG